jgi:hypothetical protein
MEFRIGINLGDVIVDGEQIYGDGVNVAARLESLADPGGICISDTVHAQIKNKLALNYDDLGPQSVKNIAEPVRVFPRTARPCRLDAEHETPMGSPYIRAAWHLLDGRVGDYRRDRRARPASLLATAYSVGVHSSGTDSRSRPPGPALNSSTAFRQHERRSQAGIFQRRHYR